MPRHVAKNGIYPGGSWRVVGLGEEPPRKGKGKDLDFIGRGSLKWGTRSPGGTKDDFLSLLFYGLLVSCLKSIFLLISMNAQFFSVVTGGI